MVVAGVNFDDGADLGVGVNF